MKVKFKPRQSGASMIEVLVSLIILGVGLLGVLSLQANGMSSSQRATFVTDAQLLAQDMADRILAFGSNEASLADFKDGSSDLQFALGVSTNLYDGIDVSKVGDVSTLTLGNDCTTSCDADATKLFDVYEWQVALSESSLPRARGTVTYACPFYYVRVMWDQDREGGVTAVACGDDNCFEVQTRVNSVCAAP